MWQEGCIFNPNLTSLIWEIFYHLSLPRRVKKEKSNYFIIASFCIGRHPGSNPGVWIILTMNDTKESLELKITTLIKKIKTSPMGEKNNYVPRLRKYSAQYKTLTGDYFKIK